MEEKQKEPGWIGKCRVCECIVTVKQSEIKMESNEMMVGVVCPDCAKQIEKNHDMGQHKK